MILRLKKTTQILVSLALLTSSPILFARELPKTKTQTYIGEARDGQQLVYTEKHLLIFDASGKLIEAKTSYLNPKNEEIARLESDFRNSINAPDYIFKDLRDGSIEGVRRENGQMILFTQEKGEVEKKRPAALPDGSRLTVGCQGFNYYLLENFNLLKDKRKLGVQFLFPGSLDSHDFELIYKKELPSNQAEIDVKGESFWLSLLGPTLHLVYDTQKKRLISYTGLSNLKNDRGKPQSVTIRYQY